MSQNHVNTQDNAVVSLLPANCSYSINVSELFNLWILSTAQCFKSQPQYCTFRPHYVPGVDSASNRNKYQEYFFWGVKAAGAYGWQPYHLHVLIVLKSGSLNLLEPSGPVQACNGTALPLPSNTCICEEIWKPQPPGTLRACPGL
jgi:hypothetical protein